MARHAIRGSERDPMPGAHAVGRADPDERMEVSVVLRRRDDHGLKAHMEQAARAEGGGKHMKAEEFAAAFGATADDITAVRSFATQHGLAVVDEHAGRRTVVLSGTVKQFNEAFGVDLQQFDHPGGSYRGRTGAVHVPDELKDRVQAVLGLDNRPVARPHFRRRPQLGNIHWNAEGGTFTPTELAKLYGFPDGDGSGQCVAILELGGGYRTADLKKYFADLGITHAPKVHAVSVDHGRNHATGDPNGPDGEVMLDIEVVGAVAPKANIVVYFAPNTDAGFLDAIAGAIHDTKYRPSVVSISWGGPESQWTQQSMQAYDAAMQEAAALGVTICVASGDNGSTDGVAGGKDHVDFPASSPHVLACGGTRVVASADAISDETVWNDGANGGAGGGGISAIFQAPIWQQGLAAPRTHGGSVKLTMRGVPDVSGDADPQTGYDIRIDGTNAVIGGTSAVAPLWAGLLARINGTHNTRVGFINPKLYAAKDACRDITQGNNGTFKADKGWDAATGLGSPNGPQLAAALLGTASPPVS